jgi:hypothetical protein
MGEIMEMGKVRFLDNFNYFRSETCLLRAWERGGKGAGLLLQ